MEKIKIENFVKSNISELPIFFNNLSIKKSNQNINYVKSIKINKYKSNRVVILPFYKHVSRLV